MSSRLQKFLALDGRRRRFLLTAFISLARSRRALATTPFKTLVERLCVNGGGGAAHSLSPEQAEIAQDIGWAVRTAAAHAPGDNSCLVQVLAAQRMLRARGIGGTCHIGAAFGESPAEPGFQAHAWLTCGGAFVTGEAGHERFSVLTEFSWG